MHRLTIDEKENRNREDAIYADARKEKQEAIEARTFYKFFYAHRADGIHFTANEKILRDFLTEQDLPITPENVELAYLAEGAKICSRKKEYVRQTDTQMSRHVAQRPAGPAPLPVLLSLTRDEILSMPADKLKRLMQKPENVTELNRILSIKVK